MKNTLAKVLSTLMIATALLGFASVFQINVVKAVDPPTLFVDPASNIFPPPSMPLYSTFAVNVSIANITGVAGIQLTLNWDPTLLQCDSMTDVFFHDPLLTKPADIPGNLQDYSTGIDNVLGTASYAMTWKDMNKAKNNGYAPANITTTGSAYGNPTYAWPEGKHGVVEFVFNVTKTPTKLEGNVNCTLTMTDVIVGDVDALPIATTNVDGYYQLNFQLPTELPYFKVMPQPEYLAYNLGEVFNISVYVMNLDPGWEAVGFEFKLGFNDTLLNVLNIYEGPWLPPFGVTPNQGTSPMTFNTTNYVQFGDVVLPDANATWHAPFPGSAPITGQPAGLLALIEFTAIKQGVYPEPDLTCPLDLYDTIVADWHATVLNQSAPVDGSYRIKSKFVTTGRVIDIFTAWPYPFGGQGPNQPSDMFWPQKQVCLYANVTYNGWPEQQKDVAFQIIAPNGQTWYVVYARTNETGIAKASFRLPWPCDNPESWFGLWTVVGTVDIACIIVNDTLQFHYDYLVHIFKVTADHPGSPPSYNHTDYVCLTIEFGTYLWQPYVHYVDQDTGVVFDVQNLTVVVTGLDETHVPFGFVQDQSTSLAPTWHFCEYRNWTVVLCVYIPKYARAGLGEMQTAILDNWPFLGGTVQSGYYDPISGKWLPYAVTPIIITSTPVP